MPTEHDRRSRGVPRSEYERKEKSYSGFELAIRERGGGLVLMGTHGGRRGSKNCTP